MHYAFAFDASACTGCKACQVACKDKNALPTGVLWRRVYEVSGGDWQRSGGAWTNSVFAYNVSMGCNHCAEPACVAACPTGAYVVRDDGVVYQHSERCIGCEYCVWACPYGAPQYSWALGRVTKCDLCIDLIDEDLPPACVAACPMRALDLRVEAPREAEEPRGAETQRLPFPLPETSARPSIVIKPHSAMFDSLPKSVVNYEEVRPRLATRHNSHGATNEPPAFAPLRRTAATAGKRASRLRAGGPGGSYGGQASPQPLIRDLGEWPLVAFTLLGQAAAGVAVLSFVFGTLPRAHALAGALLAAAALSSLLHLGTAGGAWRAPANVWRSALSREIVMLGLFAAAWVLAWALPGTGGLLMAVSAVGFVESMVRVYDLESVPGWTRKRTRLAFGTSAFMLGGLVLLLVRSAASTNLIVLIGVTVLAAVLTVQQALSRRRFYLAPRVKVM